jgi:hypothetical protein
MQIRNHVVRVLAALALTFVFAIAAAAETRAAANIPFDFELRGETLPAGRYVFQTDARTGMFSLVSPEGRKYASTGVPLGNPNAQKPARIVFRHDGETYQLAEVWLPGAVGHKVPLTERKPAEISSAAPARLVMVPVGD